MSFVTQFPATIFRILFFVFVTPLFANAQTDVGSKFIENKGQWNESIKFAADFPGGKLLLRDDGISYLLENEKGKHHHENGTSQRNTSRQFRTVTLKVQFKNASPSVALIPENAGKERYNYYFGKNKSKWTEGCKAYESIIYKDIYEGIDLKFYTDHGSLKYDLLLKKGADPSVIKFQYEGHDMINIEDGCFFASTALGTVTEKPPVAFQIDNHNNKAPVACEFTLDNQVLGFSFPEGYNSNQKLVIDPELIFSTFSGAASDNFGYTACFDSKGNLYSGGIIFGPNLAAGEVNGTYGGGYDMALLKYDSSGSELLYGTFIGGSYSDAPHSLIINNKNELVILGTSGSQDYPVTGNAYDQSFNGGQAFSIFEAFPQGSDIVLSKLSPSGHLVSSTFIGGPGNDGVLKMYAVGDYVNQLIQNYGDYQRGDVAIDAEDNIYVASSTDRDGFPVSNSIQNLYNGGHSDAVVFSLTSDFSQLRWGMYLGGANEDAAYSIKLNQEGQVIVGGGTLSDNFPVTSSSLHSNHLGQIDGFITKIDQENNAILQSTYLGTGAYDQVYMIDLDEDQNVYAVGQTRGAYPVSSKNLYTVANSAQFIHKLTPDLDSTIFSTVFGDGNTEPNISPTAFMVSECERLFISGWGGLVNNTNSPNNGTTNGLPVTQDALFPETDGSDFYLMVLTSDGEELLYATFFGADDLYNGDHVDGGTSRFDKSGIVYQSVCSCGGSDDNFPTTPGAWSRVNRGVNINGIERCNNAAFKFDLASLKAEFEADIIAGCAPLTVNFNNTSAGGEEHLWTFGDGSTSTTSDSLTYTFSEAGTYPVSLYIKDNSTCIGEDSAMQVIRVYDIELSISESVEICEGETVELHASGGHLYSWSPSNSLNNSTIANPLASPDETTTYTVKAITENGCEEERDVTVIVTPNLEENFEIRRSNDCYGVPEFSFVNHTESDREFVWDFGDGTTSTEQNPTHIYEREGTYLVNLVLSSEPECLIEKEESLNFQRLFIPNVFTPNNDNKNDFFVIRSDLNLSLQVFDRAGKIVFRSDNYENNWNGDGLNPDTYYYQVGLPNGDECNGWVQILK